MAILHVKQGLLCDKAFSVNYHTSMLGCCVNLDIQCSVLRKVLTIVQFAVIDHFYDSNLFMVQVKSRGIYGIRLEA